MLSSLSQQCRNPLSRFLISQRNYGSLKGRKSRYARYLNYIKSEEEQQQEEDVLQKHIASNENLRLKLQEHEKLLALKKFKTIERKYFKKPNEVNLLTWDAKEQIRYLHRELPDEWPIERLAESFPISVEGLKKLLRSQYAPKSMQEIIKHDKKVQNNWMLLQDPDSRKGPVGNRYERLFMDPKLKYLEFAAGNKALPQPARKALKEPGRVDIDTTGVFASIVKDYEKHKARKIKEITSKKKEESKQLEVLENHEKENFKLLSSLSGKKINTNIEKPFPASNRNYDDMYKYKDRNLEFAETEEYTHAKQQRNPQFQKGSSENVHSRVQSQPSGIQTMLDMTFDEPSPSDIVDAIENRKVPYAQLGLESEENQTESGTLKPRTLGKKRGTWKSRSVQIDSNVKDTVISMKEESRDLSEILEKPKKEFLKDLSYDFPTRYGKTYDQKEAFVYDVTSGYQHPFGKVDASVEDLDLQNLKNNDEADVLNENDSKLYKKGKNYYDVDGEFLFKVP